MALDPTLIGDAAVPLVLRRTEKGKLEAAYEMASALVEQHPDNARAHFALGYVLRYAGLLEDATARCEAALDRDPTDFRFRSCASGFARLGRYGRAKDFLRLDAGSEFAAAYGAEILLREGDRPAALEALRTLPDDYAMRGQALLRACLERRSPAEIAAITRQLQSAAQTKRDPEPMYFAATNLAVCGRSDEAIQLLREAIRGNYCSYPSLKTDPALATVREHRDFAGVVNEAKACRERFESYRRQHDAAR
jgi:tetratricopeptide (TPR) repeat protein